MPQYPLNKTWLHKLTDYFFPDNCRAMLEAAIIRNRTASKNLFELINGHEHDVVRALKTERRQTKIARNG